MGQTTDGDVLELRIHGVNNTPPAALLDLPEESIAPVLGDRLGSFWRAKPGARDHVGPGDRGYAPPEVTCEAFSWGGLARTSVGGQGPRGRVIGVVARLGWLLLLPFGVSNLAYWTRGLVVPGAEHPVPRAHADLTAGLVRLFALGLTLLGVATAAEVSLGLLATSCYRPDDPQRCSLLPEALVTGGPHAVRLLVAALLPVAFLVLLAWVSRVSRSRYESVTSRRSVPAGDSIFGEPDFWRGDRLVEGLGSLHLAAGLSLLSALLATPVHPTAAGWQRSAVGGAAVAAGVLLLGCCAAVLLAGRYSGDGASRTAQRAVVWGRALLVVAVIDLVVVAVVLPQVPDPETGPFELSWSAHLPAWLVAFLFAMVCSGFVMRFAPHLAVVVALLALAAPAVVVLTGGGWLTAVGCGAVVALSLGVLVRVGWNERTRYAFGGCAPGVFMGIALYVALLESSLVLVPLGGLLNGGEPLRSLVVLDGAEPTGVTVALPFLLFAAACALTTLAFLLFVIVVVVAHVSRESSAIPDATGADEPTRRRVRRLAGLAHRAEKAVLALAVGETVAIGTVVVLAATGDPPLGPEWLWNVALIGTVLTALGLAALQVSGVAGTRPFGLLWDLLCFLPRAAHPWGPPCYAERAVPQLADRVQDWLDPSPDAPEAAGPGGQPGRAVILSAHSLGAILAVAVLLGRAPLADEPRVRVLLLTYGVQLRAYFGRILPELLGPDVLGTTPARGAALWADDPCGAGRIDTVGAAPADNPLRQRLRFPGAGEGQAWKSLWRRTDYLGFPLHGYTSTGNDLDVPASEVDRSGTSPQTGTHGDYPRVEEYQQQLTWLVAQAPPAS